MFIIACKNGYLEIAKWLLEIEEDIIVDYRNLKIACKNRHLEIIKWLIASCKMAI